MTATDVGGVVRRVTFLRGRDLREGDTLLVWWGLVRVVGFESADETRTAELHAPKKLRFVELANGTSMTVFDDCVFGIVVTCPGDVVRGGLPENPTTRIPAGWEVDYGGNAWLDALDYNTLGDVAASTTFARVGGCPHELLADLDEATRASAEAFAAYCGKLATRHLPAG